MERYIPRLSLLTVCLFPSLSTATELNTDFLQGTSVVPSVLKEGVKYPAGEYYVDVVLNKQRIGRSDLHINPEEEISNTLCLNPDWLKNANIFLRSSYYSSVYNKEKNCYALTNNTHTSVRFDHGHQRIEFSIPQAYLLEETDAERWDYGVNGLRLTYNGNFSKTSNERVNAFGHTSLGLNLGRWVLSSNMNASRNASGNTEFTTNDLTASTAISQIRSDLLLGRAQTRSELFSDFGFYGASLRSNQRMSGNRSGGYAPVISGVATGTSRITVKQNNYIVYSNVVAAGPWELRDINAVSNGDLTVEVEDESGHKTTTVYPVATLPTLLRPGEFNYNIAVGEKNGSNELKQAFRSGSGLFMLGSLDYGFKQFTGNMATLVHGKYQSGGVGISKPLGRWGAVAASVNVASAQYDNNETKQGTSASLKYAKAFSDRTDLQLLTFRYQSRGYVEFSDFYPETPLNHESRKARYEARLSQRFDNLSMSASFWQQTYWDRPKDALGASLSTGSSLRNGVSLYLSSNWSQSGTRSKDDYSLSLSLSIPFTLNRRQYFNNNSVGYNRGGDMSYNTGISSTVNERFSYALSGNSTGKNTGASASASYAFDAIQTNVNVSQDRERTSYSGGISGSVIATAHTGVLLTKQNADTLAVVKIKDTPGVTFNNSLPTNRWGNTATYLSSYSSNDISINAGNVPDDVELLHTSFRVVPTEKAIIYREFGFQSVQRYILRVKSAQGVTLTGGNAATEQGLNAGHISKNGVLVMNMLAPPKTITVTQSDDKRCQFSLKGITANSNSVHEVRCE